MGQWQTMSTAPRDGSVILLNHKERGEVQARWLPADTFICARWEHSGSVWSHDVNFTGWRPLPD